MEEAHAGKGHGPCGLGQKSYVCAGGKNLGMRLMALCTQ